MTRLYFQIPLQRNVLATRDREFLLRLRAARLEPILQHPVRGRRGRDDLSMIRGAEVRCKYVRTFQVICSVNGTLLDHSGSVFSEGPAQPDPPLSVSVVETLSFLRPQPLTRRRFNRLQRGQRMAKTPEAIRQRRNCIQSLFARLGELTRPFTVGVPSE